MAVDVAVQRRQHLTTPGITGLDEVLTTGSQLELSMTDASQLTLVMYDPDGAIMNSKACDDEAAYSWGDLDFTLSTIWHGLVSNARCTKVVARAKGIQALKAEHGPKSWPGLSATDVVTAESRKYGLNVVAQPSGTGHGKTIRLLAKAKNRDETDEWALFAQLAQEQGFVRFEAANTIYFAAPSWLVKRPGRLISVHDDYLTTYPDIGLTRDNDDEPGRGQIMIIGEQPQKVLIPGTPLQFNDVEPRLRGRYLAETCTIRLDASDAATVTITTPTDPRKQKISG